VASYEVVSILHIALYVVNYFKVLPDRHFTKRSEKRGALQRKNADALWLDKTLPRGIMKVQKGAVDLTVGPIRSNKNG